jgi:hypothetical protein
MYLGNVHTVPVAVQLVQKVHRAGEQHQRVLQLPQREVHAAQVTHVPRHRGGGAQCNRRWRVPFWLDSEGGQVTHGILVAV